jgi:WD40 repeat protein
MQGAPLPKSDHKSDSKLETKIDAKCETTLETKDEEVEALAVLRDGRLVSGLTNGSVQVWDTKSGLLINLPMREPRREAYYQTPKPLLDFVIYKKEHLQSRSTRYPENLKFIHFLVLPEGKLVKADYQFLTYWDTKDAVAHNVLPYALPAPLCFVNNILIVGVGALPINAISQRQQDGRLSDKSFSRLNVPHTKILSHASFENGLLASGAYDRAIYLWVPDSQSPTVQPLTALLGHAGLVHTLAAFKKQWILASGSSDKTIKLWQLHYNADTNTCRGELITTLEGHTGEVRALVVLDDRYLASSSADKTIRIWDIEERRCVSILEGHQAEIRALAVLPDGRLVSGSHDGTIKFWWLNLKQQLRLQHSTQKIKQLSKSLHEAVVKKEEKTVIELLQKQNANANLTIKDAKGEYKVPLQYVNDPCTDGLAITTSLIRHRKAVTAQEVDFYIHDCLHEAPHYQRGFEHRENNRRLVTRKVSEMLGVNMEELLLKHNWKYLGHLHSVQGTFSLRNIPETEFEGFQSIKFFPLRIRSLLELILDIETGVKQAKDLPGGEDNRDKVLQKLKEELRFEMETFRACWTSKFLYEKSTELPKGTNGTKIPVSLLDALAANIANHIKELPLGGSYCLPVSYGETSSKKSHQIYVHFVRCIQDPGKLQIHIDNLGQGSERHKQEAKEERYYPYCFVSTGSTTDENTQKGILDYVKKLLVVNNAVNLYRTWNVPEAIIYAKPTGFDDKGADESYLAERFHAKKPQFVGNCVVKNAQISLRQRWAEGAPQTFPARAGDGKRVRKVPSALYEYFREYEGTSIPLRGLRKDRPVDDSKDKATFAGAIPELKAIPNTKLQAAYLNVLQGQAEKESKEAAAAGLTALHVAIVNEDEAAVDRELKSADEKTLSSVTKRSYNILHLAALTGNPRILDLVVTRLGKQATALLQAKTDEHHTPAELVTQVIEPAEQKTMTATLQKAAGVQNAATQKAEQFITQLNQSVQAGTIGEEELAHLQTVFEQLLSKRKTALATSSTLPAASGAEATATPYRTQPLTATSSTSQNPHLLLPKKPPPLPPRPPAAPAPAPNPAPEQRPIR